MTVLLAKSGQPRHIALSQEVVSVLRSIPRLADFPDFLRHASGNPLSDTYHFWNRVFCKVDFQHILIYDLRHTSASLLVNAQHSLYQVQKLLEQKVPRKNIRYTHLWPSSLLIVAQTMSTFLILSENANRGKYEVPYDPCVASKSLHNPVCHTLKQSKITIMIKQQKKQQDKLIL